jgi:hypothetical protein
MPGPSLGRARSKEEEEEEKFVTSGNRRSKHNSL